MFCVCMFYCVQVWHILCKRTNSVWIWYILACTDLQVPSFVQIPYGIYSRKTVLKPKLLIYSDAL